VHAAGYYHTACTALHTPSFSFISITHNFVLFVRYVLAMAYCLVMWGTFKKVKISFLPIGHTHDDCDQCFSCLNKKFKTVDMMTLDDLTATCKEAYKDQPEVVHLSNMANWTSLLEPILAKHVAGISKPRCFRVQRDAQGVVRHHYRQNMQTSKRLEEDCWYPANSPGYRLITEPPDLSHLVNVPFKPVDENELKDVEAMATPYMSAGQQRWWHDTIDQFTVEDGNQCEECVALRQTMMANASSKTDSKEEARRKSALQSNARGDMLTHLDIPSEFHPRYEGPTMPEPNYRWVPNPEEPGAGHYEDEGIPEEPASAEEVNLQNQVEGLMQEYIVNHLVGSSLSRDRQRPDQIKVGMVVIIRRELDEGQPEPPEGTHDKAWFVGEVVGISDDGQILNVHEWGNDKNIATTGVNHDRVWTGEARVANPDGPGILWVPKDMHMKGKQKPSGSTNRNFRPKINDYPFEAVVDYGPPEHMVQGNRNKVRPAVLNAINNNPNVLWKRPPAKQKRKEPNGSSSSSQLRPPKSRKRRGKDELADSH
jgi:hypothetical protein